MGKEQTCTVRVGDVRCKRPVMVKKSGLCSAHYKRLQRKGTPGTPIVGVWRRQDLRVTSSKQNKGICGERGCQNPTVYPRVQLCRLHYYKARREAQRRRRASSEVA